MVLCVWTIFAVVMDIRKRPKNGLMQVPGTADESMMHRFTSALGVTTVVDKDRRSKKNR